MSTKGMNPSGRWLRASAFWIAALAAVVSVVPIPALAAASGDNATPLKAQAMAPPVTETVGQIMERDEFAPPPMLTPPSEDAENELERGRPHKPGTNPLSPTVPQWPLLEWTPLSPRQILSPQTVGTSFLAVNSGTQSSFIPPDPMGDVGPSQVLVHVNGRIKVFNKSGTLGALNVTANSFWTSTRNGSGVTDPEIRYDRLSNRWYLIAANTPATDNRVMVAYQTTPGGTITAASSFTFTFFVTTSQGDAGCFADFPTFAVDQNALYIGTNMFCPSTYMHSNVYVMPKSNLIGGSPIVYSGINMMNGAQCSWDTTGTYFAGPYSPRGIDSDDPQGTEGYFIGVDLCDYGTLQIRRIGNPGGVPSVTPNITLLVPATAGPITQPASGSTTELDPGDDRLVSASMHKNKITGSVTAWMAQNIEVDSTCTAVAGGGRNGARWYELDNLTTTPTVTQSGTLCDPSGSNPRGYIYPSITETGQGHMALGATFASPVDFAGVAVAGRFRSDALGSIQSPTTAQAGAAAYNQLATDGRNRWGDYSFTDVDPNDDQTVWTFQEYTSASNTWAIRAIQLKAPLPATPSTASPSVICQGQNPVSVTITGTSVSGSEFFDPGPDTGGPGYLNHISASLAGGTPPAVTGVTFTDPTHITLSLNASSASAGAKNVSVTNPDGQIATGSSVLTVSAVPSAPSASSNTPLCEGQTLFLFASTVAGATYSWTGPNGFAASTQSPSISPATPAASGIYAVTATVNGCTSSQGTTTAIVNAAPAAPSASNGGPICAGATLQLFASTVAAATYSWTGPNGFVSNQQNPAIPAATAAATGVYSVTVTVSGCPSPAGTTSATVVATGQSCNDGNLCTTTDVCQAGGTCAGSAVVCTASDQCHAAGTCNPANGTCSNPAAPDGTGCSDGNACTTADVCQSGACVSGSPVVCTASDQCHVAGTCNPANGTCSNPARPDGTGCNDGSVCTQSDTCQSGACVGANPVVCSATDQCHVAGTCNPANGTCSNPAAPDGTGCSDGNACTQTDTCQSGTCAGTNPIACTPLDQCHVAGTCDTGTGACSNPAAPNGSACNDGNACTQTDTCQSGACAGSNPVACVPLDQCHTAGTCNPVSGVCSSPTAPDGTGCDDGNACTVTDACSAGTCTGSAITAPPETQDVAVAADKTTYSWSAAAFATQYDVVRGSVAAFPVGPGGGDEFCFDNLSGASLSDATVPVQGTGFWYLSRGENACGTGTFGTQSNGSPRNTTTCP